MPDTMTRSLAGRRLLIVEDEYLIASDLAWSLEELGAEVLGPAGSVEDALTLIERQDRLLDGAVLDVNLGRESVFPVADSLLAAGIPFVFLTGYDRVIIPKAYASVPRYEKPFDRGLVNRMWSSREPGGR